MGRQKAEMKRIHAKKVRKAKTKVKLLHEKKINYSDLNQLDKKMLAKQKKVKSSA